MSAKNIFKLIFSILICEAVGAIGALFTPTPDGLVWGQASRAVSSSWYANLLKPALQPPGWVFGPVWTILYALMGVSVFFIWEHHSNILKNVGMMKIWKWGIFFFIAQLLLNGLWSIIFFGLHSPGWALVDIIALWIAIVLTMIVFYKISPSSSSWRTAEGRGKLAVYFLVPYLLWVSFASYLNYAIFILN